MLRKKTWPEIISGIGEAHKFACRIYLKKSDKIIVKRTLKNPYEEIDEFTKSYGAALRNGDLFTARGSVNVNIILSNIEKIEQENEIKIIGSDLMWDPEKNNYYFLVNY